MADITMCTDKQCPLNMTCYRYNATPSNYQSYFSVSPRDTAVSNTVKCDHYWEFKK